MVRERRGEWENGRMGDEKVKSYKWKVKSGK
jgi:hypothetical protein